MSDPIPFVPAPPGPVSNPTVDTKATIDVTAGMTPAQSNQATGIVTSYHVHPSGTVDVSPKANTSPGNTTVFGGTVRQEVKNFVQPPSQVDINGMGTVPTSSGYHIVVGAGNRTVLGKDTGGQRVYFYNNSRGTIGSIPLKSFIGIR